MKKKSMFAQLCPILCDMVHSPPDSSVHEIDSSGKSAKERIQIEDHHFTNNYFSTVFLVGCKMDLTPERQK